MVFDGHSADTDIKIIWSVKIDLVPKYWAFAFEKVVKITHIDFVKIASIL